MDKDQKLLEEAYTNVRQSQFVDSVYYNSNLRNIFSEDIWNSNSLEARMMFIEAFSIGQQSNILEEGVLSNIGKAVLTPIQIAGKIYTSVSKPIGEFVNKYGYEKTGLKEIDEKTFNSVVSKFNQYIDKLNPQAASFIKKSLNEAQMFVKGNPIKMALLSVALTTAMSFAGAPTLAIFAAACLVRGTIGLLKGEKPIQAFGKSLLVGVIGKVLGLAGKELYKEFFPPVEDEEPLTFQGLDGKKIDAEEYGKQSIKRSAELAAHNVIAKQKIISDSIERVNSKMQQILSTYGTTEAESKQALSDAIDILADKSKGPTTARKIIASAWKRLGMSETEVQKVINDSFKNSNYKVGIDLDKPIFVVSEYSLAKMQIQDFVELAVKLRKSFNSDHNVSIEVYLRMALNQPKNYHEMTNDEIIHVLTSNLKDENVVSNLGEIKAAMIDKLNSMIESDDDTVAFVPGVGNNLIYINRGNNDISLDDLMKYTIPHEAIHTSQANSDVVYFNKDDNDLQQHLKSAVANPIDMEYLLDPAEIDAHLSEIKKLFYKETNILLNNEEFETKYKVFEKWVKGIIKPEVSRTNYEKMLLRQADFYIKAAEKIDNFKIKEILQNVATNEPTKKFANIA